MRKELGLMENSLLKFYGYSIVFREVPNEISLSLNISECPHHCDGCHSDYLSKSIGDYVDEKLNDILNIYKDNITCVCFMGGDQHMDNLLYWLKKIKKDYGLKTCVYTGANNKEIFESCFPYLDYLKIGSYKKKLGGLSSKKTNQVFYRISKTDNNSYLFENLNHLFWKKYD